MDDNQRQAASVQHREILSMVEEAPSRASEKAKHFIQRFRLSQDEQVRALVSGTEITYLGLLVKSSPKEALKMSGELRTAYLGAEHADQYIAGIAAAAIEIRLLLRVKESELAAERTQVLAEILTNYGGPNGNEVAVQALTPIMELIEAGLSGDASALGRSSLGLVTGSDNDARWLRADAELQLFIALLRDGDPGAAVETANLLRSMGAPAVGAIERVLRQHGSRALWSWAVPSLLVLKVECLEALGREDLADDLKRNFVRIYANARDNEAALAVRGFSEDLERDKPACSNEA